MSEKMKEITFEKTNDQTWQDTAIKSLGGLPFEQLMTKTIENINLQPMYTKAMYEKTFADESAFQDTIEAGMNSTHWVIAQANRAQTGEDFIEQLMRSLNRGNEAIYYDERFQVDFTAEDLKALARLMVDYPIYIFTTNRQDSIFDVFDYINEGDRKSVLGLVTCRDLPHGYTKLKKVLIDSLSEHEKGASATFEMALTLAKLSEAVWSYDDFTDFENEVAVRFAVDTRFFSEIAKLRAFRLLWSNFAKAFGSDNSRVPIIGETSLRSYTRYDKYTNILRAGNETFASVLGGVDVFTVHSHAVLEQAIDPMAERIARNIQLVIKEEAFLGHVIDPAKGSYYLDTLTKEMASKAWALFQDIEAQGGYSNYQSSGALKEALQEYYQRQIDQLSQDHAKLVGTNNYVDASEILANSESPVATNRFAQAFEYLREKGQASDLKIILLRYGNLKQFKVRTDFVRGFIAVAGIDAIESPIFTAVDKLEDWVKQQSADLFVICTDAANTKDILRNTSALLNQNVNIAGKYEGETWDELQKMGVDGMIYKGQNKLQKLTAIIEGQV